MFQHKGGINVKAVRKLDLIERVLEQLLFGTVLPGPRQLQFVEDSELYDAFPYPPPSMPPSTINSLLLM